MKKLLIIFVFAFGLTSCTATGDYTIEIIFCDDRESIVLEHVQTCGACASITYIATYKQAVPIYSVNGKTYLNVCEVKILN